MHSHMGVPPFVPRSSRKLDTLRTMQASLFDQDYVV